MAGVGIVSHSASMEVTLSSVFLESFPQNVRTVSSFWHLV